MQTECTPKNGRPEVFRLLAESLNEYIEPALDANAVRGIVAEELGKASLPRPVEIHLPDGTINRVEGRVHKQFDELLGLVHEGHHNILMVGPAGSGKTTLAKNLAEALGLDYGFVSLSAGVTETHLLGRVLPQSDGSWQYQASRFVQIYENGGVFLLDELDAADANVMVAINAALANGVLANPVNGQIHTRHAQTYIIAAANTWGRGGDHQYVGRNQLDAATLDRFVLSTLHVEYDAELEAELVKASLSGDEGEQLLSWVRVVRTAIKEYRLRRVASTRLVVNGIAALKAGRYLSDVQSRYFQDWSTDERAKVGA